MSRNLTSGQIYGLMVARPGSAECRDAALDAIEQLDSAELNMLQNISTMATHFNSAKA